MEDWWRARQVEKKDWYSCYLETATQLAGRGRLGWEVRPYVLVGKETAKTKRWPIRETLGLLEGEPRMIGVACNVDGMRLFTRTVVWALARPTAKNARASHSMTFTRSTRAREIRQRACYEAVAHTRIDEERERRKVRRETAAFPHPLCSKDEETAVGCVHGVEGSSNNR